MGCNASTNKVHVVTSAPVGTKPARNTDQWSSTGSLASDAASQRGVSATSKQSAHSGDSGFSDEYAMVITEDSAAELVKQVEEGFDEPSDLGGSSVD